MGHAVYHTKQLASRPSDSRPSHIEVRLKFRLNCFPVSMVFHILEHRDESIATRRRELHETCGEVFVSEPQDASLDQSGRFGST